MLPLISYLQPLFAGPVLPSAAASSSPLLLLVNFCASVTTSCPHLTCPGEATLILKLEDTGKESAAIDIRIENWR